MLHNKYAVKCRDFKEVINPNFVGEKLSGSKMEPMPTNQGLFSISRFNLWVFVNNSWNVFFLLYYRSVSKSVVNMSKEGQTHYEVLGVTKSASQKQIRDAFVRLSKQVSQTSHKTFFNIVFIAVDR